MGLVGRFGFGGYLISWFWVVAFVPFLVLDWLCFDFAGGCFCALDRFW